MVYGDDGGAIGFLVGEENTGLACMFTMMNNARLSVGLQGVGARRARRRRQALAYARERRQGRAPGSRRDPAPIVEHPDVARMLLTMKAHDRRGAGDLLSHRRRARPRPPARAARRRARREERAGLLTPLAKAYSTDIGVEVASLGVQVHGGMGFIEETGAAQLLRDARIAPIYEGTNGIQAIDLVSRKLRLSDGAAVRREIDDMRADRRRARGRATSGLRRISAQRAAAAVDAFERATDFLFASRRAARRRGARRRDALSAAVRPGARRRRCSAPARSPRSAPATAAAEERSSRRASSPIISPSRAEGLERAVVDGGDSIAAAICAAGGANGD